jgi:hypothetical protein
MKKGRVSSILLSRKTLKHRHEPKHPSYISSEDYTAIMNLYFKKIAFYMIRDGARFVIPQYLGSLQILRYPHDQYVKESKLGLRKRYREHVNYNETRKLKAQGIDKIVKAPCKLTGGYWWRVHWFKASYARFRTQNLYSFKFTRPNVRPNTYNPVNPEISIVPYFRDKGWEIYSQLPKRSARIKHKDK